MGKLFHIIPYGIMTITIVKNYLKKKKKCVIKMVHLRKNSYVNQCCHFWRYIAKSAILDIELAIRIWAWRQIANRRKSAILSPRLAILANFCKTWRFRRNIEIIGQNPKQRVNFAERLTRHKRRKSQRVPISLEHLEITSTKSQFLKPKKCNIFLEIYIFDLVFF